MIKLLNLLMILFLSIACEKIQAKPEDPIWGKENCGTCRMALTEKRFAIQRILTSGQVIFYDDMFCALQDLTHQGEGKLYVRPEGGDDWVPAEQARYNTGLITPMNSGVGAVKTDGTMSFAEVQKKILGK